MSSLTSTTMNGHDINIDLTDASMAGGRTDEDAISGAHKFTTADESTPTPLVTIESFIGSDLESGGSDVEGSDNEIMAKSASADNDASLQRLTGDDPRSPACWSCLGPVNPCRAVCVKLRAVESKCCPEGGKKQINFAEQMSSQSPMRRAVNCFVALTITTAIEACVATVSAYTYRHNFTPRRYLTCHESTNFGQKRALKDGIAKDWNGSVDLKKELFTAKFCVIVLKTRCRVHDFPTKHWSRSRIPRFRASFVFCELNVRRPLSISPSCIHRS